MIFLMVLIGIIVGAAIAWTINKILASKIEEKGKRIGLQVSAYIVCILLGVGFTSIFSLRAILDSFVDNRINAIEITLSRTFPNMDLFETSFNANELVSFNTQLQQLINDIDTSNDSFLERLVFSAFLGRISDHINALDTGVNTVVMVSDASGMVTIKSVLLNFKGVALNTIEPYFVFGQILIIILLFAFIGIYVGIIIFYKKGSVMYNKSMVFGDNNQDDGVLKF